MQGGRAQYCHVKEEYFVNWYYYKLHGAFPKYINCVVLTLSLILTLNPTLTLTLALSLT